MNENLKEGTAKATARRRLIRGAFSAPAVLTLYSGGAVAATSSQCDANTVQTGVALVTNADDTYLRYCLYARVKLANNSVDSYYVNGDELASMVGSGFAPAAAKPVAGKWQKFDLATKALSTTYSTTAEVTQNSSGQVKFKLDQAVLPQQWVVLRVDSNGAVVGVGNGSAGLLASDSCVSSLVGAAVLR